MTGWFESDAFGAAVLLGFRHGFDWDHVAALADLTGSPASLRRSMVRATAYAVGPAAIVLILGLVAVVFGKQLPESVDVVMERFVGVTLLALGAYIAWSAVMRPGQLPARSRWTLLLSGLGRVIGRRNSQREPVRSDHAH